MLRVLIADDHEIVRHGVRNLIAAHPGWEVVGEAGDGRQAAEVAAKSQPDVAVLDVALPLLNGIAAARLIRKSSPRTRLLLFTMHDDEETVQQALLTGVRGYVLKSEGEKRLEEAISALGAGRPYFSSGIAQVLVSASLSEPKRSALELFTTRELEVAHLIAEGYSNKAIARQLHISVKTVESHRTAVLRKAQVHTAAEFVRFAIRHNLIRA
jgi:DNA-binding NarL/FixJ family response regulator